MRGSGAVGDSSTFSVRMLTIVNLGDEAYACEYQMHTAIVLDARMACLPKNACDIVDTGNRCMLAGRGMVARWIKRETRILGVHLLRHKDGTKGRREPVVLVSTLRLGSGYFCCSFWSFVSVC